jgi:hypothetical protein
LIENTSVPTGAASVIFEVVVVTPLPDGRLTTVGGSEFTCALTLCVEEEMKNGRMWEFVVEVAVDDVVGQCMTNVA